MVQNTATPCISNYYGGKFMSFRDLFSRQNNGENPVVAKPKARHLKNEITCDTTELKKLITEWSQNEGWEFEDFVNFLELVDVKTPAKLSELDRKNNSFKCVTALDEEIHISLLFGDWFDNCSEIHVTDEKETRVYTTNSKIEGENSVPLVSLQGRNIKRSGKELISYYCEYFCHRTLKLDSTHLLKIEIAEPYKYTEKSEIFVLRNCEDIEEYLLGLEGSLVVADVYEKIMGFLNFSSKDISECESILISYIETVEKEEHVLGKIMLSKGKMQEYAIFENGETFHVFKSGNWRYLSISGISIIYHEDLKRYDLSIKGSKDTITTANPREIMNRIEEKFSKLWEFVR